MKNVGDSSIKLGPSSWEALTAVRGQALTASNLTRASQAFGETTARWAFEQWDLRKRARTKFSRADEMLFDRDGLEMASHEAVAAYRSTLFPKGSRAADLTVGIGADLIALAQRGPAIGFEIDPLRAEYARHNLSVYGLEADIRLESSVDAKWDFDDAIADPSRRFGGRRTIRGEDYQPSLAALEGRMKSLRFGVIKASPMLTDSEIREVSQRVEFWSYAGECREVALFLGAEAGEDGTWAVHLESGARIQGGPEIDSPKVEVPLEFLYEADPAAVRAHALTFLARDISAVPLGETNGYLTGSESEAHSPFARAYRVEAHGHADPKRIRAELRARNAFVRIVKLRAVREEPTEWVKKVRTEGKNELILVLYPVEKSLRFAVVSPVRRSAETTF